VAIRIAIDASDAKTGADAAKAALASVAAQATASGKSVAGLTSSVSAGRAALIGRAGAAAIAGTALGARLVRSVISLNKEFLQTASASDEIRSKFQAVFKNEAPIVSAALTEMGERIGRSNVELKEFASRFQDTLVPMGVARKTAAEFSTTLTEAAIDVASFNNRLDAEVVEAFQSALVGNARAVLDFGITMRQVDLEAEALNQRLGKTVDELNETELAALRMSLLLRKSKDALGDATRTAGSFENQSKRLAGELRDLRDEMGAQLIPVVLDSVDKFGGLEKVVEATGVAFQGATTIGKGFVGALGELSEQAGIADRDIDSLTETLNRLRLDPFFVNLFKGRVDLLGASLIEAGKEATKIEDPFADYSKGTEEANKELGEFLDKLNAGKEAAANFSKAVANKKLLDQLALGQEETDKLREKLGRSFEDQKNQVQLAGDAHAKYLFTLYTEQKITETVYIDTLALNAALTAQGKAAIDAAEGEEKLAAALEKTEAAERANRISLVAAEDGIVGMSRAIGGAIVGFGDLREASKRVVQQIVADFIAAQLQVLAFKTITSAFGISEQTLATFLPGIAGNIGVRAKGGIDQVQAFARGGIANGPTFFNTRDGPGVFGEAGKEAFLPVKMDPTSGEFGVRSVGGGGGGSFTLTQNITVSGGGGGGYDEGMRRSTRQAQNELREFWRAGK